MPTIYKEYRMEIKREREEQIETIKKQKEEHIKNFISSKCIITSNHKDRIQASSLYDKISTLKGLSELNKYLQESEYGMNILQYMTENNSIPIVFEDKKTGCMCYARYGK